MNNAGRHVLADIHLADYPGDDTIMSRCESAIAASGMNIVAATFKRFDPAGLTAVWILSESHFTVHTYPEHRYISVDCYTCGDEGDPHAAVQSLCGSLNVHHASVRQVARGAAPTVSRQQCDPASNDVSRHVTP